ncbi:dihydrolipoamide S-succinyltransferase [Streptomyces sp. NPDC046887]|uniref:dihydrolipoamide S-succinyltransferase n=1 Tax=Streptomyces sp. NPDC046887 TaxID=3155472 RepID=UPI0033EBD7D8
MERAAGDLDTATAALIKTAIPDVMNLVKASRVGARYEHTEFVKGIEPLSRQSQKTSDAIWEGRPKWQNPEVRTRVKSGQPYHVSALDMNAAYLSALKCWLPIGKLVEVDTDRHDPKQSGIYRITPPEWKHPALPNPIGDRKEPGEIWVPDSLVRQLVENHRHGLADLPTIHGAMLSGASEAMLEKLRRALAEVRKEAIATGDQMTVDYIKAMYAKLVSTVGESNANFEIRRPDWMHIIRSKAFTNLWRKALRAHHAGLTVVRVSGTDELHVSGDWRAVFSEGRNLNQVKEKETYTLGGK